MLGTLFISEFTFDFINRKINPILHPAVIPAIIFALIECWCFVGADMQICDENQQVRLKAGGKSTSAKIVDVKDTSIGRNLNSRYRWADITCEFADSNGRTLKAKTIEGYNWAYTKKSPWSSGERWSQGSTVKITYIPNYPEEFRLSECVVYSDLRHVGHPSVAGGIFMSWFATIIWLVVWMAVTIQVGPLLRHWYPAVTKASKAMDEGRYNDAIELYKQALIYVEKRKSGKMKLHALHGMAKAYHKAGNLTESEECFQKALAVENVSKSIEYYVSCVKDYAALLRDLERGEEADELESSLKRPS